MRRIAQRWVFVVALTSVAWAQDSATDKAAFEKVCGSCHKSSLVSELKSEEEWTETVNNMIANGARGTAEQFDGVMRYLARNFTRVNVNAASVGEIAPVLDLSEKAAQAVVEYRARHGKFASLEDLRKVPGLDAAKLQSRSARISFR